MNQESMLWMIRILTFLSVCGLVLGVWAAIKIHKFAELFKIVSGIIDDYTGILSDLVDAMPDNPEGTNGTNEVNE